jgi:hypothetical protein
VFRWGCSLDRHDDGLQKASNGFADLAQRNDEILERS